MIENDKNIQNKTENSENIDLEKSEDKEEILENTPDTFEKLIEEVKDYKDKYLRSVAETDNLRKRYEREKSQSIIFANEKFASDLLETLDNFENAMKIEMPEDIKQGIDLIYKNLQKTLEKNNVIEVNYSEFNPNFHEAVSKGIGDEIKIIHRKGYMIGERLLRPAMVSIGE